MGSDNYPDSDNWNSENFRGGAIKKKKLRDETKKLSKKINSDKFKRSNREKTDIWKINNWIAL